MKYAFYVSGRATRVKKIVDDIRFKEFESKVKLVFSDNIENVNLTITDVSITVTGVQYEKLSLKNGKRNVQLSNLILNEFLSNNIDYCFCFGDHILTKELLKYYKNKIINFHPSILPAFPGRSSIDRAVINNSFLLGNTAHFIDEGIDTGPVIMQSIVHKTAFTLDKNYDDVLDLQIDMLFQIMRWLEEERIVVENNNCNVISSDYDSISFFPKLENYK